MSVEFGSRFKKLLGQCEFLTREEEAEHFRKWREEGDRESYEALYRSIAMLGTSQASKYASFLNRWDLLEDFEQAASLGIMRAIRNFRQEEGSRLITYAYRAILSFMQREYIKSFPVKIPDNVFRMEEEDCKDDRYEKARFWKVGRLNNDFSEIEVPEKGETFERKMENREMMRRLEDRLPALTERTQHVIRSRLRGRLLREIAEEMGISRERVRQIQDEGVRKLQGHFRRKEVVV